MKTMSTTPSPAAGENAATNDSPTAWLEEITDAVYSVDAVDRVDWRQDEDGSYIVEFKVGDEPMRFEAATDGKHHGIDYDGNIHDMTTASRVQFWIIGELYDRLKEAKRDLERLESPFKTRMVNCATTHKNETITSEPGDLLRCDEILKWNDAGTKPVKRCGNAADWKNLEPGQDSVCAICDGCAAVRFSLGLGASTTWARVNAAHHL